MTPDGNGRVRVTEREEVRAREEMRPIEEQVERAETRISLSPVASPSILGFFALGHASWIVGGFLANWFGAPAAGSLFFPFVLAFGGLGMFLAGMWAFRARDHLGSFAFTMWGTLWLALGAITLFLDGDAAAALTTTNVPLGMIFVAIAAATWIATIASAWRNLASLITWGLAAAAATAMAIGALTGATGWFVVAGWLLVATAVLAWYTAAARLFNTMAGHMVLPVGQLGGARRRVSLDAGLNEPGITEGW
jgi:succinate-acetate transporter protein